MSRHVLGRFLSRLPGEWITPTPGDVTDADLLERFLRRRDEAAFEGLVSRHGRMVFGVCRRLLGHAQDAEDAFQATFLALVRKGGSIRQQGSLGGWLYRVAYRIALRARRDSVARTVSMSEGIDVAANEVSDPGVRELGPLLDEEVNRLPEKQRTAVVLCYLSGRSTTEAAGLLGVPRGTVLSRLAWARQRLRSRLVRRGVAPALAGLTACLAASGLRAAPTEWTRKTLLAALGFAAGLRTAGGAISARALSLMEGVFRAMMISRLKVAAAVLVLVVLAGMGLARWVLTPQSALAQDVRSFDSPKVGGKLPVNVVDKSEAQPAEVSGPGGRPVGTWERQFGPCQYTVRFEADRAHVMVDLMIEGQKLKIEGDADYSVTKDSVLYGVITSAEVQGVDVFKGKNDDLAEFALIATLLTDYPFSLRYRLDDNVLTIKDVNIGGLMGLEKEKAVELIQMKAFVIGRYKKSVGKDASSLRR